MRVVGQMSGTSLDGVDFVLCDILSPTKVKFLDHATVVFPLVLRKQLVKATLQQLSMREAGKVHFELGKFYAQSLAKVCKSRRWRPELIGLHGQTVYHAAPGCTWQMGEASFTAQFLKVPVVYNLRVADVAAGGQGAPLAPIFHALVFGSHGASAVQNLGGISNVTFFDSAQRRKKSKNKLIDLSHVHAFDTGPANMLMNLGMEKITKGRKSFDRNGKLAVQGIANAQLVHRWLKNAYFHQKPPKSTGREEFGEEYFAKLWRDMAKFGVRRPQDKMATLLEFTAQTIAVAYKKFGPSELKHIFVCGGGSQNKTLIKRLQILLSPVKISSTDELGWSHQTVEGGAFALMAYLNFHGYQLNLKTITGSRQPVTLGQLVRP